MGSDTQMIPRLTSSVERKSTHTMVPVMFASSRCVRVMIRATATADTLSCFVVNLHGSHVKEKKKERKKEREGG